MASYPIGYSDIVRRALDNYQPMAETDLIPNNARRKDIASDPYYGVSPLPDVSLHPFDAETCSTTFEMSPIVMVPSNFQPRHPALLPL
jgi:hypothetical protein